MSTYRTEGIILRRSNFGEANLLIDIYTRSHGKVQAVGRSARKSAGKLKGLLEPFLWADFMIAGGRRMDTVANSYELGSFLGLRRDYDRVLAASAMVDMADKMTMAGHADERIFRLLLGTLFFLEALGEEEKERTRLSVLFFGVNLLGLSGFAPQLEECVFCDERLKAGGNFFSNSLGGVLDPGCAKKCPDALRLDDNTLKLLRYLALRSDGIGLGTYEEALGAKLEELGKLRVESSALLRALRLLKEFSEFNLDTRLGSLEVLSGFAATRI